MAAHQVRVPADDVPTLRWEGPAIKMRSACRLFAATASLFVWAAGGCVLWAVVALTLAAAPSSPDGTRAARDVLDTLAGRGKARGRDALR